MPANAIEIAEASRPLHAVLEQAAAVASRALHEHHPVFQWDEVGRVTFVGQGVARLEGLSGVWSEELIRFPGNVLGMAFNLDPDEVGVILLDSERKLSAGAEARREGRVLDVPVGEGLLGRVVDPIGRPLDRRGSIRAARRLPVERPAHAIMDRAPVTVPLQTGVKVVDALVPIGRGQRELILGDRQTGKTALAVDTILNQQDQDVICVYCAIGQRVSAVARVLHELEEHGARPYTVTIVSTEDDPPGLQFVAPYAAMSMAEHFMHLGRDVLVVLDDLTRHARAYRELSLLLRRPPGREAFPGDIFYVHSRLLERSTHLRDELGGGSITALPIAETEAENLSAFIPTNLISITDGQIYLSPRLFDKSVLPAVDVGRSVSRVGGKTQLPAYRAVVGDLRLIYSQFEELEAFARFGTRLDESTREALERGRRVREILKQDQHDLWSAAEQVAMLCATQQGVFDETPLSQMRDLVQRVREDLPAAIGDVYRRIQAGERLEDEDQKAIVEAAQASLE